VRQLLAILSVYHAQDHHFPLPSLLLFSQRCLTS
jgi:hypothetical protein